MANKASGKRSRSKTAPHKRQPQRTTSGKKTVKGRGAGRNQDHFENNKQGPATSIGPAVSSSCERLYGKHSVRAVFLKRPGDIEKLVLAGKEDYHTELIALAQRHDIPTFLTGWPELEAAGKFGENDKHQGVLAYVKARQIFDERDFDQIAHARCVLVLDQVSNPQNLATIIRSAAFFHADAICFMKNRAATPTPEVVRFAVGGAEHIDLYQVTNISNVLDELKNLDFNVLGLDERGEKTLAQHDLGQKTAFVIGAEGEGLRAKTKNYCTDLVRIPGGRDGVESLNAAVATTIALYEFSRLMGGKNDEVQ